MKHTLQWHPAFEAAMQIELSGEADKLQFLKEFNLTNGPLRIDTLIIKMERDARVEKRIGRIFRQYNILEYKSPGKSHTVNGFFKVMSYAGLLQSGTKKEQEIPPEEITITLIGNQYPKKLMAFLKKRYSVQVNQECDGIYYVNDLLFPLQIVVQRELDPRENVWLSRLRQDLQMERDVEVLARAYRGKDSDPLYSAVMDLIVRANWKMYKEGETVCDALNELFADKMEAKRREGERRGEIRGEIRGEQKGERKGKAQAVLDILSELGEIPAEVREAILSQENLDTLTRWLKLAARSDSIHAFAQGMERKDA